jgi:hypothetical protein
MMVVAMASPVTPLLQPDHDLAALRRILAGQESLSLVLDYAGRTIRPGYHVTEIKAAHFAALDCGGNPDNWTETVLQVEDVPAKDGGGFMTAGKFLSILGRVERALELDETARVTFEISRPGEAMQVFDIAGILVTPDRATISLESRHAICKPRHRAAAPAASACCAPSASAACCA